MEGSVAHLVKIKMPVLLKPAGSACYACTVLFVSPEFYNRAHSNWQVKPRLSELKTKG